jgi:DNA-binding HxlR family transcriptional regulator
MGMARDEACGYCPHFHRAIELIGRRWTGAILQSLLDGTTRFSDIRDSVPGLSDRLLSERLRELEELGVVERNADARDVQYRLTEVGEGIEPVLDSVGDWARQLSAVTPLRD